MSSQNYPKKIISDTVTNKNFDPISDAKVLGADGSVVSKPSEARKDLVEDFLTLLQNTVEDKLSGTQFFTKLDLFGNHVHNITAYTVSLREATESIMDAYPSEDRDEPLKEINELCDVLDDGVNRVSEYVETIKKFGDDLDNIKSELYTQIQILFQEI